MSMMKSCRKLTAALGCVGLASILGGSALGGCTAEAPAESVGVAEEALSCSPGGTCNTATITAGRCNGGTCFPRWEHGSFQDLEDANPSHQTLTSFVASLSHPTPFTSPTPFTAFDGARQAAFDTFVNAMMSAAALELTSSIATPDWCNVAQLASAAGYRVMRFYDPTLQRWLLYSHDDIGTGHAYFFFNPEPHRPLVIEAPHVGTTGSLGEDDTKNEAVYLFEKLTARALLINGADRCSGLTESCGGSYTSDVCGFGSNAPYREGDIAHSVMNAFQGFHAHLDAVTENHFVQLHGKDVSGLDITANDGRNAGADTAPSMANDFETQLVAQPAPPTGPFTIASCQQSPGGATTLCGETNVQGRLTAKGTAYSNPPVGTCFYQGKDGSRFLHLEQGHGVVNTAVTDPAQKGWPQIAAALGAITTCFRPAGCDVPAPSQDLVSPLGCGT